jgi:phosphatidylserine decarboxylase
MNRQVNFLLKTVVVLVLCFVLFIFYFMREQTPIYHPTNNNVLYSPAHGRIMKIFEYKDQTCISIFLSPLDIHQQYIPINGTVRNVSYDYTGKFELAFDENKSRMNEKCITELDTKYGKVVIYQIAGFFVRRIVNRLEIDKPVITGQNMGVIKFGSRVDVLIPSKSKFHIDVKVGDYVNGTHSKLGHFF